MTSSVEYVTHVIDGDTFTGDPDKPRVRLKDVDAPELTEPGGIRAKQHLESIIGDKYVTINTTGIGRFRRRIAEVSINGVSVNEAMRRYLRSL